MPGETLRDVGDEAGDDVVVRHAKMARDTRLFNKGQDIWVKWGSGCNDLFVSAKHRGKGRYIKAWVREGQYENLQSFPVTREFAERHDLTPV